MKYDASRLAYLAEIKETRHATVLAASDQARELRTRRGRLDGRITTLRAEGDGLPGAGKQIATLSEQITTLDAEIARVEARRDDVEAAWQEAAALLQSATAFARSAGLPLPATVDAPGLEWPQPEGLK